MHHGQIREKQKTSIKPKECKLKENMGIDKFCQNRWWGNLHILRKWRKATCVIDLEMDGLLWQESSISCDFISLCLLFSHWFVVFVSLGLYSQFPRLHFCLHLPILGRLGYIRGELLIPDLLIPDGRSHSLMPILNKRMINDADGNTSWLAAAHVARHFPSDITKES